MNIPINNCSKESLVQKKERLLECAECRIQSLESYMETETRKLLRQIKEIEQFLEKE